MAAHAILSPSGAHRWMRCVGAPAMEKDFPETSSKYADEGTAAHTMAAEILSGLPHGASTMDMLTDVMVYVDFVRSLGGTLLVEEQLPIDHITGEQDATGTGDAIVIDDNTLKVIDLKFGRGQLVDANMNEQLMMYALGALRKYEALGDFTEVHMYIHQPRVNREPSLFVMRVNDLLAWAVEAAQAATQARELLTYSAPLEHLTPGEKQCQWCKAKATCPKLAAEIERVVGACFEDLTSNLHPHVHVADLVPHDDRIGKKLDAVDLIENWCKAVRAEVERRLLAGVPVPGYKIVQGKRGNRAWRSEEEVEELFKSMRLKVEEKYTFKLISPTAAEKLLGDKKSWSRVVPLITQSEGGPSVAPTSDKRPEYSPAAKVEDFVEVTGAEAFV